MSPRAEQQQQNGAAECDDVVGVAVVRWTAGRLDESVWQLRNGVDDWLSRSPVVQCSVSSF